MNKFTEPIWTSLSHYEQYHQARLNNLIRVLAVWFFIMSQYEHLDWADRNNIKNLLIAYLEFGRLFSQYKPPLWANIDNFREPIEQCYWANMKNFFEPIWITLLSRYEELFWADMKNFIEPNWKTSITIMSIVSQLE